MHTLLRMETKNSYDHLFELIRNDDTEAFDRLYSLFYPSLCVFASRYISEYKAIEDCVQDVFLKIWRDRKSISINTSVRSYLYTAMRNHCLNFIEKKKTELTYEQYILRTYDPYTVNDLHSIEELENIIEDAIQKLPDKIQQVFRMSRFEHMTYKEIAEKQNISIKTVESYIHKALISLSLSLKDYLPFLTLLFFFKKT